MHASPLACAAEMLEVVPLIMRVLRAEVRSRRMPELSVPQFRALAFVGRNEGAKLSDLANFLGLTAPSASKLIDGLVAARLVEREAHLEDRRRISLALSPAGSREYEAVLKQARDYLGSKVAHLSGTARERLLAAMRDLRVAFEQDQPSELGNGATHSRGTRSIRAKKQRALS